MSLANNTIQCWWTSELPLRSVKFVASSRLRQRYKASKGVLPGCPLCALHVCHLHCGHTSHMQRSARAWARPGLGVIWQQLSAGGFSWQLIWQPLQGGWGGQQCGSPALAWGGGWEVQSFMLVLPGQDRVILTWVGGSCSSDIMMTPGWWGPFRPR
jgi:hypothetical protein